MLDCLAPQVELPSELSQSCCKSQKPLGRRWQIELLPNLHISLSYYLVLQHLLMSEGRSEYFFQPVACSIIQDTLQSSSSLTVQVSFVCHATQALPKL